MPQLSIHQFNNILNVLAYKSINQCIINFGHGSAVPEILMRYNDIRCNLTINNKDGKRTVDAPCVKTRNILFRTHTSLRREARSVVDVTHVQPVVTGVVAIFVSASCHALSLPIHDCARNGGSAQRKGHATDTYARARLPM